MTLQGQLLIASPQLLDPNFAQTVVLIVRHDEEGALGLVLNRPLSITLEQALEQSSAELNDGALADVAGALDQPLYKGGPCEGPLMVVHTHAAAGQIEVMPGVHFSTERESIERLLRNNVGLIRFFLAYSGWGAGQLESELEAGGWLVTPATKAVIFHDPPEHIWRNLHTRLTFGPGVNPKTIPTDPRMN